MRDTKLYLAAFAALLGPLSFGFALGYSSPVIAELGKIGDPDLRLDGDRASWFGVRVGVCVTVTCFHLKAQVKKVLLARRGPVPPEREGKCRS